jgi:hypothetical protein
MTMANLIRTGHEMNAQTNIHSCTAYLIVVQNAVIRQDIAQAIAEVAPDSCIIATDTLDNAAYALADADCVSLAFVEAGPDIFRASPLAAEIAARGVRLVLTGSWDDHAAHAAGWDVLSYPFQTADIHRLLSAHADFNDTLPAPGR